MKASVSRTLALIGALLAGVACFVISANLFTSHQWWSNLFANTGVALVLAAPVAMIAHTFTDALASTNSKLNRLAVSIEDLRESSAEKRQARFEEERELFRALTTRVSFDAVRDALQKSRDRGYLHPHGIRVELQELNGSHLRFQLQSRRLLRGPQIVLYAERNNGKEILKFRWTKRKTAQDVEDFFINNWGARGQIPYDLDVANAFENLSSLLIFTAECKHNLKDRTIGDATVLGAVQDWVFTDLGLTPMDKYYLVARSRINNPQDIDWIKHISGKNWDSAESFPFAYTIAEEWYPTLEEIIGRTERDLVPS